MTQKGNQVVVKNMWNVDLHADMEIPIEAPEDPQTDGWDPKFSLIFSVLGSKSKWEVQVPNPN